MNWEKLHFSVFREKALRDNMKFCLYNLLTEVCLGVKKGTPSKAHGATPLTFIGAETRRTRKNGSCELLT
jgi:hypothetical protein